MLYPSRTARLALRAWREEDQPAFAAMNADERVMEYFPATLTAEESADLLDRIRDEFSTEGFGPYAVERLSDGELLGFTGLHRVTFSGGLEGQVEILWRLRHDAWGQGYATEAARACIAHAAKLGIPELVAFTFVGNGRSRRVMQKLGMTCVGEFDHPALPEGHPPHPPPPHPTPPHQSNPPPPPRARALLLSGCGIISTRIPPCREYRPTRRPHRP